MSDQLIFLVIVGTAVWVGYDAHELGMRRGRLGGGPVDMGVASWVVCCLLLWVVAFPCYLVARSKYVALRDAPLSHVVAPVSPFSSPAVQFGAQGWPVAAQPVVAQPAPAPAHAVGAVPAPTAPPQLSADGHWWWDGTQWIAAAAAGQGRAQ